MSAQPGRIAWVDLQNGTSRIEQTAPELRQAWLGGRGLGVGLLTQAGRFTADSAPLVLAPGSLCQAGIAMADRAVLSGVSPATGGIFSVSAGGRFALALQACGFDALVLEGAAQQPLLLRIAADRVALEPAGNRWGLTTGRLFDEFDQTWAVAAIGPAGEQGCSFASVETRNGEPFDRGGLGALLGQRRVKALLVAQSEHRRQPADPAAFDTAQRDLQRLLLASPFLYGPFGIREQGTVNLVDPLAQRGMLPGRNFGPINNAAAACNSAALRQQFTSKAVGCGDCPVACKRSLPNGGQLPGYDGLAAFSGLCGISDPAAVVTVCAACCQLGLDPVSTAGSLAAWAESTGRRFTADELPGLVHDIAYGHADGKLLARGAQRLTLELGRPELAMTVKGLELPPYDPRAACGLALAYAVAPHGGTHLDAWPLAQEVLRKPVPMDPRSFDGKARAIALAEEVNAALDSLGLCRFIACAAELEECAALFSALYNEACRPADLLGLGRRIVLAERAFNRACGITEQLDDLPQRFFSQGNGCCPPLDRQAFLAERERYQRIRQSQEQPQP